jgi:hypothetical protein
MAFSPILNDIELMRPPEGTAYSFNADEDVIAGQAVVVSSDNSVAPSDTDGEQVIGVCAQTVAAGDTVMVLGDGARVRMRAGASVTAGSQVASRGGTGEEGEVADASGGDHSVALAHEGASDGDTFVGTVNTAGGKN